MRISPDELRQILVHSGYVKETDYEDARQSAVDLGREIDDVLIFRGLISEDALGKLISEFLHAPYAGVGRISIPHEVLELIPERLARTYRMIPFEVTDQGIKLAMEDPSDFEALEFARRHTGKQVIPHYSTDEDIRRALGQYKKNIREEFDRVIQENIKQAGTVDDPTKAAERLPIIKVLDTILEYAVAERASDVHIETQQNEVIVRYRIDGVLRDIIKLPRGIEAALIARIKIVSNLKIDEHRIPQDGRYKFKIDDDVIALRISIIPGFYGENVVARLLSETTRPLSLEELGVTGHNLELIKENIYKPHGMLLVTGPTGSGKTTTLYSILNILNTVKVKICTIEDPIEYGMSRVTQIQVNTKAGMDFAAGLRSLLRHDPNIIMVGEIRDKETAQIAVNSALTGHLVLSTLHTNDASGAIPRLLDMGVEGFLVASTTNAIMAQRLVRKSCQSCLVPYEPSPGVLARLAMEGQSVAGQKFYKGQGCAQCHNSGYQGRLSVCEVLPVTEKIRELVTKRSASDVIKRQAIEEGMITMMQDGLNKVASGQTTIEEVLRAVMED